MANARLRLIDIERAERAPLSRCRELVPRERAECARCHAPTFTETTVEMALFIHGGYGADRTTTFVVCTNQRCRHVRIGNVVETNPRTRAPYGPSLPVKAER